MQCAVATEHTDGSIYGFVWKYDAPFHPWVYHNFPYEIDILWIYAIPHFQTHPNSSGHCRSKGQKHLQTFADMVSLPLRDSAFCAATGLLLRCQKEVVCCSQAGSANGISWARASPSDSPTTSSRSVRPSIFPTCYHLTVRNNVRNMPLLVGVKRFDLKLQHSPATRLACDMWISMYIYINQEYNIRILSDTHIIHIHNIYI